MLSVFRAATMDEKRSTSSSLQYENIAGHEAVVSEKLHFRCDRVSQTRVVRYQSKDTAETVTLYIDICFCNVLVFRVWSRRSTKNGLATTVREHCWPRGSRVRKATLQVRSCFANTCSSLSIERYCRNCHTLH